MCDNNQLNDPVNRPAHYLKAAIVVEPIELTSRLDSCLGQALQYVLRAPLKGNEVEDLEKAIFYLNKRKTIKECGDAFGIKDKHVNAYIQVFKDLAKGYPGDFIRMLFLNNGFTDNAQIDEAMKVLTKRIREVRGETVVSFNPNGWNEYPKVTPPEGVLMRVEFIFDGILRRNCSIFENGAWRITRNGDPSYDITLDGVTRFRPWED